MESEHDKLPGLVLRNRLRANLFWGTGANEASGARGPDDVVGHPHPATIEQYVATFLASSAHCSVQHPRIAKLCSLLQRPWLLVTSCQMKVLWMLPWGMLSFSGASMTLAPASMHAYRRVCASSSCRVQTYAEKRRHHPTQNVSNGSCLLKPCGRITVSRCGF